MFGKRNKNNPELAKGNSVKKTIKHHSRCGLYGVLLIGRRES
jgi:hypothetical protein